MDGCRSPGGTGLSRLVVLIPMLVGLATCAPAAPSLGSSVLPSPVDEVAIRSIIQASADAWNRGDLRAHLSLYSDSVTFMTQSGPLVGIAAIEQSFQSSYFRDGAPRQKLRFEQLEVRVLGENAALATGRFVLSGGGEAEQSGWFSLVWQRTPSGWEAVHDHSS